jgi:hypothetical protein
VTGCWETGRTLRFVWGGLGQNHAVDFGYKLSSALTGCLRKKTENRDPVGRSQDLLSNSLTLRQTKPDGSASVPVLCADVSD